ncbi:MAG: DNA topoisomerase IB [Opitutaceae bacterium]|nr:DNA topoisomerase IB [Cytophagales bacterium]
MVITVGSKSVEIPKRKLTKLSKNYEECASVMDLIYVNDQDPGIERVLKGKNFEYVISGKKVSDTDTLKRIKDLVIPPAWQKVWISPQENGHIQVTGLDNKGRKQYRYHPLWIALRDETKYFRLRDFGRVLPEIRKRLQSDLSRPELPKEKVLAAVVSVMERTSIRVGNNLYEKIYGSYGLSTMKDRHIKISGSDMRFSFKGKKGVYHTISLKSRKLANIVAQCKDIPGKELFQYFDENGKRHAIDSGDVNKYIKEISGGDFTSKDFRTWTGTVNCLLAFKELGCADTPAQLKRNMTQAIEKVAQCLGNTKTVCKKHYVHPLILSGYQNQKLDKYIRELEKIEIEKTASSALAPPEQVLLKLLENS